MNIPAVIPNHAGKKDLGFVCPEWFKTIEHTDDTIAFQICLNLAKTNGKVTIHANEKEYRISNQLTVYSNTTIVFGKDTVVKRNGTNTIFALYESNKSYDGYFGHSNIHFENGTIDGNVTEFNQSNANLVYLHRNKNVTFENMVFKDVLNTHALDANGVDGLYVKNCRFVGFYSDGRFNGDRTFSEAIQLAFAVHPIANKTDVYSDVVPSKNVVVMDCYFGASNTSFTRFDNVAVVMGSFGTGVGHHSSVHNLYVTNIEIKNNVFEGHLYAGVRVFKFKDVIIENNTFLNCKACVHVSGVQGDTNAESSKDANGTQTNQTQNAKNVIIKDNFMYDATDGNILIFGSYSPTNTNNVDNVDNVKITNNTFDNKNTGLKRAISCHFATDVMIQGNTFKNVERALYFTTTNELTFSNNNVDTTTLEAVHCAEFYSSHETLKLTHDIIVSNNVIKNISYAGIHLQSIFESVVENNTFKNVSTFEVGVRNCLMISANSSDLLIRNNTALGTPKHKSIVEITSTCTNCYSYENLGKSLDKNSVAHQSSLVGVKTSSNFKTESISLASGISNHPSASTPSYTVVENGVVFLSGAATHTESNPANPIVLGTLPVHARPIGTQVFITAASGSGAINRIKIESNGTITREFTNSTSNTPYNCLDGIVFRSC